MRRALLTSISFVSLLSPALWSNGLDEPIPAVAGVANAGCGNGAARSPTGPPCECDPADAVGAPGNAGGSDPAGRSSYRIVDQYDGVGVNKIRASTGNAARFLTDLSLGGRAFAPDLRFTRYSHTRFLPESDQFGDATHWRHNHQWTLTATTSEVQIIFPDGTRGGWLKKADGSNDPPQLYLGNRLYKESGRYRLSLPGGTDVVFHPEVVAGTQTKALVDRVTDSMGRTVWYANDGDRITGIADDFGRWFLLEYGAPDFITGTPALTPENPAPVVLRKVSGSDGREVTYQYSVHNQPSSSNQHVALAQVNYGEGAPAKYEYVYNPERLSAGLYLSKCEDPMYGKGAVRIQYEYVLPASRAPGMVWKERNPLTSALFNYRSWPAGDGAHTASANGLRQKHVMDSAGFATEYEEKDADGNSVRHIQQTVGTYAGKKAVTQRKLFLDGAWKTTAYEHNVRLQNVKTVNPDGSQMFTTYDDAGRVTQVKETRPGSSLARVAGTVYNPAGWVLSTTVDTLPSTTPQVTTYSYSLGSVSSPNGQPLQITAPSGLVTRFTYDADGRLLESRVSPDPDAVPAEWAVTTYEYGDPLLSENPDRLVRVTDPLGRVTEYETNWSGQLTSIIHPDATTESWVYDDFGNMVAHSNELGKVTFYTWDEFRRLRTRTDPLSGVTEWRYGLGAAGCGSCHTDESPTEIISPSGRSVKYEYNVRWKPVKKTEAPGAAEQAVTEYSWDAADRLLSVTDPMSRETAYEYDPDSGNLLTVTDALGRLTEYEYDEWDNVIETALPGDRFVETEYDEWSRPVSVTRGGPALSETTETEYDSLGRVVSLITPGGGEYEWSYDGWGRVESETRPGGVVVSREYNIGGQITKVTPQAGAGWAHEFTYDSRGRTTLRAFGGNFPGTVRASYDDAGRLLSLTTHTVSGAVESGALTTLTWLYDDGGLPLQETLTLNLPGETRAFTTEYLHDADGRITGKEHPSGLAPAYVYDQTGRLKDVLLGSGAVVNITRNTAGEETARAHNNGWTTTTTRDLIGRPTALTATDDNSQHGVTAGYTWNVRDEIEQRTRKYAAAPVRTDDFTHDQLGQILTAAFAGTGAAAVSEVFTYDLNGNRTAYDDAGNNKTAQFDAKNQLTQYDGSNTAQDANGNLTKALKLEITDIAYDAFNRPVEIDAGDENLVLTYDGLGRMIRLDATGGDREDTTFIYDLGWQCLEEYGSGSAPKRKFVYGAGIDEALIQMEGTDVITLHRDLLGSPLMASDENGDILRQYHPTGAFGRTKIYSGPAEAGAASEITQSLDPLRISFTGRTVLVPAPAADNPILLNYRHRVYSPLAGRFLQSDPIGLEGGGGNLYRYVGNGVLGRWIRTGKREKGRMLLVAMSMNGTRLDMENFQTARQKTLTSIGFQKKEENCVTI